MDTVKSRRQLAIAFALMAFAFVLSLCVGRYPISLQGLWSGDDMAHRVFFTLRLPRSIMAALAGFGLSVAGGVYQTVFKNPLASPDIIGVSSGASAGAAVAILFAGGGLLATSLFAFVGGLCAVALALALAGAAKQKQLATFVLSGIAVNAVAQAILMLLKILADPARQLAAIEYWTMGSLAGITAAKLPLVFLVAAVALAGLFVLHRQVLLLALEGDEARMLGLPLAAMRRLVLILATLVVAAIVSVTGLISFIGLLGPHIAKLIARNNRFSTMLLSGAVGSILLLTADCLARSLAGSEIPISVLTSLLGAPFLVYLVRKGEKLP